MLKNLLVLQKSEGLRSVSLTTIGNIVSTALGAIAIILASRFLSPSDFGIFSAIFSMMLMVSKFGDLGTNIAFQRTLSQPTTNLSANKKQLLITSGFVLKLALFFVCLVFGLILTPTLTTWLRLPTSLYVAMGLIFLGGIIFYDYVSVVVQSEGKFGLAVFGSGLQSALKIVVILLLIATHSLTPLNLIFLYGITPILSGILMTLVLPIKLVSVSRQSIKKSLLPIVFLAKWTLIATISAALADNIDVLMVQSFLSSHDTGLYAAAFRIASFAAVASYSIGIVLNVRVAKYKNKQHLDSYLIKAHLLAITVFVGMFFVSLFSPLLISLTAGQNYLAAIPTLNLLLYSTAILMATTPYIALFYTLDAPSYFGISGLLTAVLLICCNYLLLPSFGILGAGYAKLITRAIVFVFTLAFAWYAYRQKYASR